MMNLETIQAVIAANRAIQMEARKWNIRAGEIVFPVMTSEEWKLWLASRLNGAISCATVINPDLLRLAALDVELVNLTREMNPDSITVLGKVLSVEYREPYYGTPRPPQVTLGDEFISSNRWNELPNEGVKLPGGRALNVILKSSASWSALAEGSDIPALKQTMKSRLNEEQWSRWTDRPFIAVLTEITDEVVLPEIITAVYGKCVVTGDALEAFGTLTAYQYGSSDPITWKSEWFRVRAEAETAFSKAQAELEKAKVEARDRREREAVQKAAEAAKSRAKDLYGEHCSYSSEVKVEGELRDRLYSLYYAYLPSDLTELREWTAQANTLIGEVEATVADGKRKHEDRLAEDARLQAEAEKQFGSIPDHLLSAFGGNKATTLAFMQKVAKLQTTRLNEHIVCSCGRARRREHLIEVSGDPEFFMGADPNDVSWYVADVHLYQRHTYQEPVQTPVAAPAKTGSSLDDLAAKWGARKK